MKAIQITTEAYEDLVKGRELAIKKAKEQNDLERVGALQSMGIGAFAGYLILTQLSKLEQAE